MALFLFIALVMFFLFAKFYTIAKKKDVINGNAPKETAQIQANECSVSARTQ